MSQLMLRATRWLMVGVGILIATLVWPSSSWSEDKVPNTLTTTSSGFASDDNRYFSYIPSGERPVIVDTVRHTSISVKGADGCEPVDASNGRVLLSCVVKKVGPDYVSKALLASAETGRTTRLGSPGLFSFDSLGRYWAMGATECVGTGSHCSATIYRNLRTGKGRGFPSGFKRPDERNIDQRSLLAAPNHPKFRLGKHDYRVVWNRKVLVTDNGRHLKLWRKGKKVAYIGESIGFDDNPPGLDTVKLGGGQFAWYDSEGAIHSIDLDSLERHKIEAPTGYVGYSEMSPIRRGLVTYTGNSTGIMVPDTEYEIQIIRYR